MLTQQRAIFLGTAGLLLIAGIWVGRGLSADAPADDWTAPADAAAKKNPVAADAASIAAGKAVYGRNCQACHGDTGKGDGAAGAMFNPPPRDLSNPKIAAQSDGSMFWKISEGKKPMPGFGTMLTETERWQVVNFIRSLEPKAAASQPDKK